MPLPIVAHGVENVRPQPPASASSPVFATKIPLLVSPSMPSQLSSANVPSGTSVVDGGAHALQPVSPWHVSCPAHVPPSGVVMLHAFMFPVSAALQSHAVELGRHCFAVPPPATATSPHV